MRVTIIGTGYVGLVTGACLASLGNEVICLDTDERKIEGLRKGIMPIFEAQLKEVVERNVKEQRLSFTTDKSKAIQASEIVMIAVGTPQRPDGTADLSFVEQAAHDIAHNLNDEKVIVTKSTVPVGTNQRIHNIIESNRRTNVSFHVASNPEFLREGRAVRDFMNPDRVVIGTNSRFAQERLRELYTPLERTGKPILLTDIASAEMIKYASNVMLAMRISFMNAVASLCEQVGADVKVVAKGMGLDARIGPRFLQAGCGYGGSCFSKDISAFIATFREHGCDAGLFEKVCEINDAQKVVPVRKLLSMMGSLVGKRVALLGISFKPDTDDIRDAPSLAMMMDLVDMGAKVVAFDPVAVPAGQSYVSARGITVEFAQSAYDACRHADAVILVTEWDEFRALDMRKVRDLMRGPYFVDARNIYEPNEMRGHGFIYQGIGRGIPHEQEPKDHVFCRRMLEDAGQAHVFKYWNELSEDEKERLRLQIESMDVSVLQRMEDAEGNGGVQSAVEPVEVINRGKETAQALARAKSVGEAMIAGSKVAVLTVAGGQGTRLGFDGPKGLYLISPIRRKSIFQLHAEKLLAIQRRYGVDIPWYIMTSQDNHGATVSFFERNGYFGLSPHTVQFIEQGMLPSLSKDHKMVLQSRSRLLMNPDGHGGVIRALSRSGALEEMKRRNIEVIFYFQVDNILIDLLDPVFIGYHVLQEAQMSAKSVEKVSADEKVGVFAKRDGCVSVIEYTELPEGMRELRAKDGTLLFKEGNTAIHLLNVDFVDEFAQGVVSLPFHKASKVARTDFGEVTVTKYETFIFDAMRFAKRVMIMKVDRSREFAPVKNAQGNDSPTTAVALQTQLFASWLEHAGVSVPRAKEGRVACEIEISPLFALDEEELARKIGSSVRVQENRILLE